MSGNKSLNDVKIIGNIKPGFDDILTESAIQFISELHRRFNPERKNLLNKRINVQEKLNNGWIPDFLAETENIRKSKWSVTECPNDLQDRRVEITGPAEAKMMINALNCGAKVFMADIEDSCSPTWDNVINGQINLKEAVRKTLEFTNPDGKQYRLNKKIATLMVRPRGWHLEDKNIEVDGEKISASLMDFGLYIYHNAEETVKRGTGPYLYLPKLENHFEARLWNNVFNYAQDYLSIPKGTIRATVLIENILAAYEMDEILHELKEHICGLNAGRWDYLFSIIKKFQNYPDLDLPDRILLSMNVPFMKAYTDLLVKTCHKRNVHAIGGMAAFIPSRKDQEINRVAIQKVKEDKQREVNKGFDGTWIAHPDLVSVAGDVFDQLLGDTPNQKKRLDDNVIIKARDLINFNVPGGKVTESGVRNNISVAIQYLDNWLNGIGAVGIFNLMEDVATAEIARSQLWHWHMRETEVEGLGNFTSAVYNTIRDEEIAGLLTKPSELSVELLDSLVLNEKFVDFLTLPAYKHLN